MAYLFTPTRRDFLAAAAATLTASRLGADEATVRWALLSDTHSPGDPSDSFRGFRPFDNLRRAVSEVLDSKVAAAYVNGDLARNRGSEEEYRSFKQLTAPLVERIPLALGLGNHDNRERFLAAITSPAGEKQPVKGKQVTVVRSGPVQLVFLDSQFIDGQVPGLLGRAQRTWLEGWLKQQDAAAPVLLFLHHTLSDNDGDLLDTEKLLRIAAANRSVKAVFYGHSHRYQYGTSDGVHLVNLPAIGYNFTEDQPVGWVEATFSRERCDLRLHAMGGNRTADGKTRSLTWRA